MISIVSFIRFYFLFPNFVYCCYVIRAIFTLSAIHTKVTFVTSRYIFGNPTLYRHYNVKKDCIRHVYLITTTIIPYPDGNVKTMRIANLHNLLF